MIEDRDILEVTMEENLHSEEHLLRFHSRRFDYRGTIRFTAMETPPHEPAVRMAVAAVGPLFRAYAAMPFANNILKPLLVATMDRLLPELYRSIRRELHPRILRPGRRLFEGRLPVENYLVQGEVARQHMDRLEAAFRHVREAQDGSLVSLDRGEVVRPRPEPELFLDPEAFDPAFRRDRLRTAEEIRRRGQHALRNTDIPAHYHVVADDLVQAIEADIFGGIFAAPSSRSFSREAVERSRETLVHCLNDVQRAEFERTQCFSVVAQNGRIYKVKPMAAYNVEDSEYEYCCVPATPCPLYDKMLASKLWLEAQFEEFMATANRSPRRGGRSAPRGPYPWMHFDFAPVIRNPAAVARIIGA